MKRKVKTINYYYINTIKEIIGILLLPIILRDLGVILAFFYFSVKVIKGKKEWYLKALFYFFLYRFLNPIFLPPSNTLTICSWLILIVVLTKGLLTSKTNDFKGLQVFFIFCVYALFAAIVKSEYLAISLFKLISFFLGFLAVFLSLRKSKNYPWEGFLFVVWAIILLTSTITIIIPAVGYNLNGIGFQGITNHPNFFGPFNAIFGGSFIILYIIKRLNGIRRYVFVILQSINIILVYLSESRTAFLILIILASTSFIILENKYKLISKYYETLIFGLFILFFVFIVKFNVLEDKLINFMVKDRTDSSTEITFDEFSNSRAGLFDTSMENFKNNPWLGIGFGAPNKFYEFEVKYLPNTNIPISAAVEKGVIISLLLEEVGVIGFMLFMIYYLKFLIPIWKYNRAYFPLVLAPIILNMGEAAFFSTNGQGIFLWMIIILAFFRIPKFNNRNEKIKNMRLARKP